MSLVDTFLLQYIMWSRPGDESPLKTWLMTNIISEIDSRGLEFIIGVSTVNNTAYLCSSHLLFFSPQGTVI